MADKPEDDNADNGTPPPSLTIDWELYAEHLEDSDLTDDQKREFIETLWNIVVAFVDLGFGIHPVQQACEQNDKTSLMLPDDLLNSLQDIPQNKTQNPVDDALCSSADQEES
jgi:hypothetical protein